ncbi:MAG: DUF2461 domain-containing protein [Bacteroidales bacterium]
MLHKETLEFFRELRRNNHKEWFDQNRSRYQQVKKDYHRVVGQILERMQAFDPALAHVQVKDCTFRINRDIRFAKDKTPYKTHLGISISPLGRKFEYAGYYAHLDENNGTFAGGGIWMPSPDALKKIRSEIAGFYEDLGQIVSSGDFTSTFGSLDRDENAVLTRPPKGYDKDHPAIGFLKLKSFTATHILGNQLLSDPRGVDVIVEIMKKVKPLNDFINRGLKS